MERLSDKAIEIINALHTERLDYDSEYLPLIDCAQRCAAYEDTGYEPGQFEAAMDAIKAHLWDVEQELKAYKDTGLEPDTLKEFSPFLDEMRKSLGAMRRLKELTQADKDGRLVVLPCNVGASLYEQTSREIVEYEIESFSVDRELFIHATNKDLCHQGMRIFGVDQIGKTIFLTRQEAEGALRKETENA